MRIYTQPDGRKESSTKRRPSPSLAGAFRLLGAGGAMWLILASHGVAQTLRLGPMDIDVTALLELGLDSNVDDIYPEEEIAGQRTADFYWMPGLKLQSQAVPMGPRTSFDMAAGLAYQDYFYRNDLDTELYNLVLNFQTANPKLTLGGMGSVDLSVEGIEDQYVRGSASRDPVLTREANVFADWNHRRLSIETHANYSIELHQYEQYQEGDMEETILFAGAYFELFTWGSLFYSVEHTVTKMIQDEETTDETVRDFGLQGAIPLSWLAHPRITYSLGIESTETDTDEEGPTWEPKHTIRVEDDLQLSKTIHLSAVALWENEVQVDDVSFQYDINLTQQLGARAEHGLTFSQEPQSTFGSNLDTETTTYSYNFKVDDLFIHNLTFGLGAEYEENTPLGETDNITEKTTTIDVGLAHTRQLSRKLSRVLAYEYTWEKSNFHNQGANERHLLTYGFTYAF